MGVKGLGASSGKETYVVAELRKSNVTMSKICSETLRGY